MTRGIGDATMDRATASDPICVSRHNGMGSTSRELFPTVSHDPNGGGVADSLDEAKAAFRAAGQRPLSERKAGRDILNLSLSDHDPKHQNLGRAGAGAGHGSNGVLLFPRRNYSLSCKSVAECLFGSNRGEFGRARSGFVLGNQEVTPLSHASACYRIHGSFLPLTKADRAVNIETPHEHGVAKHSLTIAANPNHVLACGGTARDKYCQPWRISKA
jgi:hypothetical protein